MFLLGRVQAKKQHTVLGLGIYLANLSIYLSTYLPIFLSFYLPIHPPIHPSIHPSISPYSHLSLFLFVSSIHCRTPTIQRSTFLWVHTNNLLVYFSSIRLSSYSTCVSAPSISRPVHVSGLISLSIQALFVHPVVYPITSNNPEPGGAKVADQGESIPTVTHLRPGTLPCKTFPKPALITN